MKESLVPVRVHDGVLTYLSLAFLIPLPYISKTPHYPISHNASSDT